MLLEMGAPDGAGPTSRTRSPRGRRYGLWSPDLQEGRPALPARKELLKRLLEKRGEGDDLYRLCEAVESGDVGAEEDTHEPRLLRRPDLLHPLDPDTSLHPDIRLRAGSWGGSRTTTSSWRTTSSSGQMPSTSARRTSSTSRSRSADHLADHAELTRARRRVASSRGSRRTPVSPVPAASFRNCP